MLYLVLSKRVHGYNQDLYKHPSLAAFQGICPGQIPVTSCWKSTGMLCFLFFFNTCKQSLFRYLPKVIRYRLSRLRYAFSAWVNSGIFGWISDTSIWYWIMNEFLRACHSNAVLASCSGGGEGWYSGGVAVLGEQDTDTFRWQRSRRELLCRWRSVNLEEMVNTGSGWRQRRGALCRHFPW